MIAFSHRLSNVLRAYVMLLGIGLFLEGLFDFVLGVTSTPSFLSWIHPDPRHDVIHIIWGLAIMALPLLSSHTFRPAMLATSFGCFYLGLGFIGVLVHHPLGLRLDPPENVFHFTVGTLALALGLIGLAGERRGGDELAAGIRR